MRASVVTMTQTLHDRNTTDRLKIHMVSPEVYDAMMKLSAASAKDVDPTIGELVKIRASQINHCAFCLDMHVTGARKQGETEQRLALVAAWEEAGTLFTDRERAALELTEAITELTEGHVPDEVYAKAAAVFTDKELAQVIAMAVTINAWNRISVSTRVPVPRR